MTTLLKKKTILFVNLSVLAVSSILSLQSNASDAVGPGDSDSKWVLGVSAGAINNPYSGEDGVAFISPNIRYNGDRFFVKDGSLNLHIAKTHGFSGGLKLALDGSFLSDSSEYEDNEKLAGLTERDGAVLGGVYLNHDTDMGRLSFNFLSDVGDEHDGETATLKYTFDLTAGNWSINPMLGAAWASDDYVNHYIGVSKSEATTSRSEFRGEATIAPFAGIRARYEITDNWDVNFGASVTKLGSEVSNSSIIDDDVLYGASFDINYNF